MTSKKEQVWSTTENKYVEVEIEGSRGVAQMGSKLEQAARAHSNAIYEKEGDSHSECSEYEGFKAGAKWLSMQARGVAVGLRLGPEAQELLQELEELVGDK